MRFTVQDNNLIWDNEILGSTTALYADANEKLVGKDVIGNKQTPHRIDYLMVAGENVVGVESKTVNDLIASWVKGRLQRQLKVLYETVDIPYAPWGRGRDTIQSVGTVPLSHGGFNKVPVARHRYESRARVPCTI